MKQNINRNIRSPEQLGIAEIVEHERERFYVAGICYLVGHPIGEVGMDA